MKSLRILIDRLSGSEKRYIRLSLRTFHTKTTTDQEILFDVISSFKGKSLKTLENRLEENGIHKNIAEKKYHLQNTINSCLVEYYKGNLVESTLRHKLEIIDSYQRKGMIDSAFKTLQSGKFLAQQNECFELMLEFQRVENRLMSYSRFKNNDIEDIQKLRNSQKLISDILLELNQIRAIFAEINLLNSSIGVPTSSFERKVYRKAYTALNDFKWKQLKSFSARWIYTEIQLFYHSLLVNIHQYHRYTAVAVNLLLVNPTQIKRQPSKFIIALHNFGLSAITCYQADDAQKTIHCFKNLSRTKFRNTRITNRVSFSLLMLRCTFLLHFGNMQEAAFIENDLKKFLKKSKTQLSSPEAVSFEYKLAYIHFIEGKYKASISVLNHLIELRGIREDLIQVSYLLLCLNHYELGNLKLLSYFLGMYKRRRKGQTGPSFSSDVNLLVKLLTSLSNEDDTHGRQFLFEKYADLFEGIQGIRKKNLYIGIIDGYSWVKSHISSSKDFKHQLEKLGRIRKKNLHSNNPVKMDYDLIGDIRLAF